MPLDSGESKYLLNSKQPKYPKPADAGQSLKLHLFAKFSAYNYSVKNCFVKHLK